MNIKFGERIIIPDYNKIKFDRVDEIVNSLAIKGSYNIFTQFVESFDNVFDEAVVKSIISFARENGVDEVVLLDKKTVLSALEKQIPRKPIKINEDYNPERGRWVVDYECPSCGNPYAEDSYCSCCGQALLWEGDIE
jgi:hypothetical protein